MFYLRQDATHVENFCIQIGQVGHNKDENRFNDTYIVGEACNKAGEDAPHHTDKCTAQGDYQERGASTSNIHRLNITGANFVVRFKHVVQHNLKQSMMHQRSRPFLEASTNVFSFQFRRFMQILRQKFKMMTRSTLSGTYPSNYSSHVALVICLIVW